MDNLFDLIIYSLDDGEDIDKFSAEYITNFSMNTEYLSIKSTQRNPEKYQRDKVGFYFQGR